MLIDPQQLIDEFITDLNAYVGVPIDPPQISHDTWVAPHQAKDLPIGSGAVYVFSLSSHTAAPAGAGRVIKVGKAGPTSNARFRYQHYAASSAMSTLAGAIKNNPLLWGYLS